MKKTYTSDELFRKAASFCSISEHCISEVEEKLRKWEVSEAENKKILLKLIAEDFINEKRYAVAYAKDKFRFNKWGKHKISMNLKAKNIASELIENAVSSIDNGEYEEMLASILKKKLESIHYEYEYERQGKLFKFAQNKGFETDIINRVLRTI